MSSIDEIIARSRQPGAFKEVRRFTVARAEAMQKMRKFALADPNFYILELIQAAVANGAVYLDIATTQTSTRLSYYGGGFRKEDLEELFEFLFAAKSDVDLADVRQLALGINAVIAARPDRIVIESGLGTLETTHRIVISEEGEHVEVGTPTEALNGTYISISGMDRFRLNPRGERREHAVLMERCLMAPIPILLNNDPIFGTASVRNPTLFGFAKRLTVNEDGLYGTIGVPETQNVAHFKIVTYGVWIQSLTHEHQGRALGGVISCDALRKSADHSSIVQDEMLGEMWFRLTPYFEQLRTGQRISNDLGVKSLDGVSMSIPEVREALRGRTQVLLTTTPPDTAQLRHLIRMSEGMDAPVLVVNVDHLATFRQLFPHVAAITPRFSSAELELFSKPDWAPPPYPWLAQDVELAVMDSSSPALQAFPALLEAMGDEEIVVRAYFPEHDVVASSGVPCEVVMANRLIWSGSIDSDFSGFHLCVEVPVPAHGSEPGLNAELYGDQPGQVDPRRLVMAVQQVLREPLESHCTSIVATLGPESNSASARHLILSVLQGKIVSELAPLFHIGLRRVDRSIPVELLHRKVFLTIGQEARSLWELSHQLTHRGVVYGVLDTVEPDLEGLDLRDVLWLNEWEEMALIQIIGAASYVRIDARDELARFGTLVVRDWAEGLMKFSDEILLIEGGAPTFGQRDHLASQLLDLWQDRSADTENRRQAHRHLIHFMMRLKEENRPILEELENEPLFPAFHGLVSLKEIFRSAPVAMMDGWPSDLASQHVTQPAAPNETSEVVLKMHPLIARFLRAHDLLRPRGFAQHDGDLAREMIARHFLSGEGIEGEIDLVRGGIGEIQVLVSATREVYYLADLAREFGISGVIRVQELTQAPDKTSGLAALESWLYEEAKNFYGKLLKQVLGGLVEEDRQEVILGALFGYMGRHLLLVQEPSGLKMRCTNTIANQVLSLPVIMTRVGILTPLQVIQGFLAAVSVGEESRWAPPWTEHTAPSVVSIMREICTSERILRPPSSGASARMADYSKPLLDWLNKMLEQLSVARSPIRVVLTYTENAVSLCDHHYEATGEITLRMSTNHPMVKHVLAGKLDRTLLLLSLYASASSYFPDISFEDEIAFQAGLADLLIG